jgi:hypothetical protein
MLTKITVLRVFVLVVGLALITTANFARSSAAEQHKGYTTHSYPHRSWQPDRPYRQRGGYYPNFYPGGYYPNYYPNRGDCFFGLCREDPNY